MSDQALTCHEIIELLSTYIEGGLTADDRSRVDEHLALCDGCTTYLEQMREDDPPERHGDRGAGARGREDGPAGGVPRLAQLGDPNAPLEISRIFV